MAPYLILIGIVSLLYFMIGRRAVSRSDYLDDASIHAKTRDSVILITVCLIFLMAMRDYTVGLDTTVYRSSYQNKSFLRGLQNPKNFWKSELGYDVFQYILYRFHMPFEVLLLAESVIYVVPAAVLIFRYSKNPYMSFFLFIAFDYYLFGFSAIRQSIAMGICMIAFEQAQKKKLLPFSLLVLLAATFHITAAVFALCYILPRIPLKKKYIGLALGIGFVFFLFRMPIREFVRQFARINYNDSETGGTGMYLLMLSMVILDVFVFPDRDDSLRHIGIFRYYMLVTLIVYPILQFNPAIFRLHFYYSIMMVIYFPNLMHKINRKSSRFLLEAGYTAVSLYYMFAYTFSNVGAVPYKFCFTDFFNALP